MALNTMDLIGKPQIPRPTPAPKVEAESPDSHRGAAGESQLLEALLTTERGPWRMRIGPAPMATLKSNVTDLMETP